MSQRDVYYRGFDEANRETTATKDCPECEDSLVADGGEVRCTACGLVVEANRIDPGPEWRSFEEDETNPRRTGAPLTPARHDRGLSTEIGYERGEDWGTISLRKRRQLGRLRREHNRAKFQTKADRNLANACSEIARLTSALDLPRSVREEASVIYRRAQETDLIRGRSIETITGGSVYAAARCGTHTLTLDELATVAQCSKQKLKLGYRVLNQELGLEATLRRPRSLIPKFASECDAPDSVQRRAVELAEAAQDAELDNGRSPAGVAAACLYQAAQENGFPVTQQTLAQAADVSTPTLRARLEELEEV